MMNASSDRGSRIEERMHHDVSRTPHHAHTRHAMQPWQRGLQGPRLPQGHPALHRGERATGTRHASFESIIFLRLARSLPEPEPEPSSASGLEKPRPKPNQHRTDIDSINDPANTHITHTSLHRPSRSTPARTRTGRTAAPPTRGSRTGRTPPPTRRSASR